MNTLGMIILFFVVVFGVGWFMVSFFRGKYPEIPSHQVRRGLYRVISVKRVNPDNRRWADLHFTLVLIGQSSIPLSGKEEFYILSEKEVREPRLYSGIPEDTKRSIRNTLKVIDVGGVKTIEYFGPKTFEIF